MTQIISGAEAIAKAVGLRTDQIYHLKRRGFAPIHHRDGIGLVADPQELKDWILGKHTKDNLPQEKRPTV